MSSKLRSSLTGCKCKTKVEFLPPFLMLPNSGLSHRLKPPVPIKPWNWDCLTSSSTFFTRLKGDNPTTANIEIYDLAFNFATMMTSPAADFHANTSCHQWGLRTASYLWICMFKVGEGATRALELHTQQLRHVIERNWRVCLPSVFERILEVSLRELSSVELLNLIWVVQPNCDRTSWSLRYRRDVHQLWSHTKQLENWFWRSSSKTKKYSKCRPCPNKTWFLFSK